MSNADRVRAAVRAVREKLPSQQFRERLAVLVREAQPNGDESGGVTLAQWMGLSRINKLLHELDETVAGMEKRL